MDRISKALERAKKNPTPYRDPKRSKDLIEDINYTHTKTVDVSEDILEKNRVISSGSNKMLVDIYRVLRTRVLHRLQQNNWKVIGVTSARPEEGKTLTAVNLGISIAMEPNYSVLLVDADLRRPGVHQAFGITPTHGLSDYLTSDVSVEELFINPGIGSFVMLPCVKPSPTSSELLTSPKMVNLLEELKLRYTSRLIIFNLPPLLMSDDVAALSPFLDAVLMVVEDGKTRADDLGKSLELLEGVNLLGTVLNKCKNAKHDLHYYKEGYY
jgi:capsular exopolysaccharide synthesis family protein